MPDIFARVQEFIDSCSVDERRAALLRLMWADNNGDKHFDHGDPGYSWACLRCARRGLGGLNGWAGVFHTMAAIAAREEEAGA